MARILLLFARIASTPRTELIIPKTIISMMMTPVGDSIAAATRRNGRIFAIYIGVLIVSAVVIAFFTWLTWDSGNKVQDAIQSDANARIEEAKAVAAQANQKTEEERLERVKIEERLAGRRLTKAQREQAITLLKPFAGHRIFVAHAPTEESRTFAIDIFQMLRDAGWDATLAPPMKPSSKPIIGIECLIDTDRHAGVALRSVMQARGAAITPTRYSDADSVGSVIVGLKPPPN